MEVQVFKKGNEPIVLSNLISAKELQLIFERLTRVETLLSHYSAEQERRRETFHALLESLGYEETYVPATPARVVVRRKEE